MSCAEVFEPMTTHFLPSQSPILSFVANTGQFLGKGRYGRWSYQTGSCGHSDP